MVNFWNLERGTRKERTAKAKKLREHNALPAFKESSKVGRKKGRIAKPVYGPLSVKPTAPTAPKSKNKKETK
jgi:hypothetical protein